MSRAEVVVDSVEVAVFTVPTDAPEADGTFAWDATTLVLVSLRAGGALGIGWTYGAAACAAIVREQLRPAVEGRSVFDVAGAWSAMVTALRNVGRPGVGGMALSAVDCALWDLKARLLDLPLHRLLGAVHGSLPPETAAVFYDGGLALTGLAAPLALAILLAPTAVVALRSDVLPRWLGWVTAVLAVLGLVTPLSFILFLLFPVWVFVTSILLYREQVRASASTD